MRLFYSSPIFKVWPLKKFGAICLGRWIFFSQASWEVTAEMMQHEMTHQRQMDRYGVVYFYVLYLCQWFSCLLRYRNFDLAYRNIPLEKEAYGDNN